MPTPRDQAQKHGSTLPGEDKSICYGCGGPMPCECAKYQEWGENGTNAGSASADDKPPFGKMGNGGGGNGGGKKPPFLKE